MTADIAHPLVIPLDGSIEADRSLLGGKAWGLQYMHRIGMPVPPAFTLTTRACAHYFDAGQKVSEQLWSAVLEQIDALERNTGSRLGGVPPLTVSVRSGAPVSMPGMMDTLLNVGQTRGGSAWATRVRNAASSQESLFARQTSAPALAPEREPERAAALQDLRTAISRIFDSWHSDRAKLYRHAHGIASDLGTSVTIQAMVMGDLDNNSGTGVYVTRNPLNGVPLPYGEWLPVAQGEQLVSGQRTPQPLTELQAALPDVYAQLLSYGQILERAHRNVLEIEFTVEAGTLYLLQARTSSSSPAAAARWAVDFVRERRISVDEALRRVPDGVADEVAGISAELLSPLAEGFGVSSGVRAGRVVRTAHEAEDLADRGESVVLARPTTSPHDLPGFLAADAVITERGGSTSHAAVVARQLGLPCVVGCGEGTVDRLAGALVTVDAGAGRVYAGDVVPHVGSDAGGPADIEHPSVQLARWRAGERYGVDR